MSQACVRPTGRGGMNDFRKVLRERLEELYLEHYAYANQHEFIMPVGLLLAIDERNGGDVTAKELFRRFDLLHWESQNTVDFYFLGWEWVRPNDRSKGIRFDLQSFASCRRSLRELGVNRFGGNADLILVDAHYSYGHIKLNFNEAIYVNLSSSREEKDIPPIGEFFQSIIQTAEEIRKSASDAAETGVVFFISDRLGLATGKKSFLDFILQKWGTIIGAKKLAAIAIRNIGPIVDLDDVELECIPKGPQLPW